MDHISLVLIFVLLSLFLCYNWRRRWLYFYSWRLPGPFSLPIVGTVTIVTRLHKDLHKTITEVCKSQPPIFRLWMGNHLHIIDTQPEDLEILLNTFLEKSSDVYGVMDEVMRNSLLTAPVNIWRSHRKAIRHSFNPKIIASFYGTFVKTSKALVETLKMCDQELTDMLPFLWKCTLDASLETLAGVDPSELEETPLIPNIERGEEIMTERSIKYWVVPDFLWRLSNLHEELMRRKNQNDYYVKKMVTLTKENMEKDILETKIFLPRLILENEKFTETDILNESFLMLAASSETTAIVVNTVVLVLGLYPDIQDKIHEEVSPLFEDDAFATNIPRLDYLERVVKETIRLFPPIPLLLRHIDHDITLGSYVFPGGSHLMVPISHLHRRPDLWPNPLNFDPDRFLPEEIAKRQRCAYIPFSFGPRNCIGPNYALASTKVMLAHIVKNFAIKALNYASLEELDFHYHILHKPIGYRIMLTKRLDEF